MCNPKISIICVTKNAAKHLENCLKSICNQSYKNIELIIQDGQSTDRTLDIIHKYQDRIAYYESAPDKGLYDAMNKALGHATGDWIYFIGADDYLYPEFSNMIESDLKDINTIYYSRVTIQGGKIYGKKFSSYRLTKGNMPHQSMFYPASVFKKYQYPIQYIIKADYVLNIQLRKERNYTFEYVNKIIANHTEGGISSQYEDKEFERNEKKLVWKYFGLWVNIHYWFRLLKIHIRSNKI